VRIQCPANILFVGANIPPSNGFALCESNTAGPNQLTLMQRNSNNIVAMNDQRLNQVGTPGGEGRHSLMPVRRV
jgi:hypothetical protein